MNTLHGKSALAPAQQSVHWPHPSFGHPPQMRHLNLGWDSKSTGRIWRGIWLRDFSAPKQSPRLPTRSQRKPLGNNAANFVLRFSK